MKPSTIPLKDALTYRLQVKQRSQHTLLSCGLQQGGDNTMQHNTPVQWCVSPFVEDVHIIMFILWTLSRGDRRGETNCSDTSSLNPVHNV